MAAGHTFLRGPSWSLLHADPGGWQFVLVNAAAVSGPGPAFHFTFAALFGDIWTVPLTPVAGTTRLDGNIELRSTFLPGCVVRWPCRVIMESAFAWDRMKNTVDEVDVPSNTVLRYQYHYVPLPWDKGETCNGGSLIWTDAARPRDIQKLNSSGLPRYEPQVWRFLMP